MLPIVHTNVRAVHSVRLVCMCDFCDLLPHGSHVLDVYFYHNIYVVGLLPFAVERSVSMLHVSMREQIGMADLCEVFRRACERYTKFDGARIDDTELTLGNPCATQTLGGRAERKTEDHE